MSHPYRTVRLTAPMLRYSGSSLGVMMALLSMIFYGGFFVGRTAGLAEARHNSHATVRTPPAVPVVAIIRPDRAPTRPTLHDDQSWMQCDDAEQITVSPSLGGFAPVLLCDCLMRLRDGGVK